MDLKLCLLFWRLIFFIYFFRFFNWCKFCRVTNDFAIFFKDRWWFDSVIQSVLVFSDIGFTDEFPIVLINHTAIEGPLHDLRKQVMYIFDFQAIVKNTIKKFLSSINFYWNAFRFEVVKNLKIHFSTFNCNHVSMGNSSYVLRSHQY